MTGLLFTGVAGLEVAEAERSLLSHPRVAGVVLFARNYASRAQVTDLCAALHALPRDTPLLVSVDQEGGRVQRFEAEFTRLPALGAIGDRYDEDPGAALEAAREIAWLLATELREVGVDFSFTPVVDLRDDTSRVIGRRAFHASPDAVTTLADAQLRGLAEAGMGAVLKHFPGHGGVVGDTHVEAPRDARPLDALLAADLAPFDALSCRYPRTGVLASHVIFPAVDCAPAGFSKRWLVALLRERLGFDGPIFSDDLGMRAADAAGQLEGRVRAALDAGCDAALCCNDPVNLVAPIADALDSQDGAPPRRAAERLAAMRAAQPLVGDAQRLALARASSAALGGR